MRKIRSFCLICFLLTVLFSLLSYSVFSLWSSPSQYFNTTTDTYYLNWTNGYLTNVTITANNTHSINFTAEILNTTGLTANYTQFNDQSLCSPTVHLYVLNSSGYGSVIGPLNGSTSYNSANVSLLAPSGVLIYPPGCTPGRYTSTQFMIRNYTNSAENLNLTVVLDLPISSNSTLNRSTGVANFGGSTAKMPVNATTYHSYWFNATSGNSDIPNATSVVVNLTDSSPSQDIDLFLFDSSGNLLAQSVNTSTYEWLTYSYLPSSNQMYEIRVYGNTSSNSGISYNGYVIFSTLNATSSSSPNQQISSINFGNNLNATNTTTVNLLLTNAGNITLTNVTESKELAFVQRFTNSGSQNITFLVPSSLASRVKVDLNWTGSSNYTSNIYKPDGTAVMSTYKNYLYANKTNATQEVFNETTDIGTTSGYWRIDVRDKTSATDSYNLTTFVYVNASNWISSNYTTMSFSQFNQSSVQINLTVPNETLDGTYEGFVQYQALSGAALRIPVSATTKAASLVVNKSISSSTVQIDENIGANITRTLNVAINNTGSYSLPFTMTNSSGRLNLTGDNTKYINFSYDYPPTPLTSNYNGTFNITFTINTNQTGDSQGVYTGWITFVTNDSHPYQNFTLNLNVNLTNYLASSVNSISTLDGNLMTSGTSQENITVNFSLTYVNGSGLENPYSMGASSFAAAWLDSANTSFRVPTTGNLTVSNGSNPIYSGGLYGLNLTIPENQVGGFYETHIIANYTKNSISYSTEINSGSARKYLIINNTGLLMSTNASGCSFGSSCNSNTISLDPGNATTIYVNVSNFGPLTSAGNNIMFNESCSGWYNSSVSYTGCPSTSFVPTGNSTTCIVSWTITAATNTSGASACTGNVIGYGYWYNLYGVNITVAVNSLTSSSNASTGSSSLPSNLSTAVANYLNISSYSSMVYVTQGKTNTSTVVVKNTNRTKTQTVSLTVDNINSSWVSVTPSSSTLAPLENNTFSVVFSVLNDTEVKDYSGKFTATSSYASVYKNFTLRVLPGEAKKIEINMSLNEYKLNYTKFSEEINVSKAEGLNTTVAEAKLSLLKAKIDAAQSYIDKGDYFSANSLLPEIKSLIADVSNEILKLNQARSAQLFPSWVKWVLIGAGAAGCVVLLYLFWPEQAGIKLPSLPKIFKPEKKEIALIPAEETKENPWEKLREKFKEIKKKS